MASRPALLLVPILGFALAFVAKDQPREMAKERRGRGAASAGAANPHGAWGNAFHLKKHAAAAEEWAGEALKRGRQRAVFAKDFSAVVSNPADAAKVVERDYGKALVLLGAKDPAARASLATRIAQHVLAVYDPTTATAHVLPENARRAAEAAGDPKLMNDDTLRLLLARVALVGLMRQETPEWKAALDGAQDLDGMSSAAAVFQGLVQVQTRRITGNWNRIDSKFSLGTFDDLTKLLTAPPHAEAKPDLKAFAQATKFALLKGEAFMGEVPTRYRMKVLKAPPAKREVIFDPKTFVEDLRAEAKRGPVKELPGKVHANFKDAFMAEGEWTHESADLAAADAEAMLAPLKKRFYSTAMAAFRAGWASKSAGGDTKVETYVIEMRSEGQAEGLVSLLRGAAKDRGATLEDGAGRDLGLNGFHGHETVDDATWHMQWASEGQFVIGFRTTADIGKEEKRLDWDEAMEGAAEDTSKVAGSRESRRRNRGR